VRAADELALERIEAAARAINPLFRDSPQFVDSQLSAALGREVLVKVEIANPLGSFKGRGADFLVRGLERDRELVCSTAGNFGQAIAYAGRAHGLAVHVFAPAAITAGKLARIRALDAAVTVVDGDGATAKAAARDHAAASAQRTFVEDGREPAIAEGAGTIGIELLAAGPLDAVVVPVGDGALIAGVGRWVKAHSPATRIIGVGASGAPAMALSWRAGRPVSASADTVAGTIATSDPVPEGVARMRGLVDDFVLVDDEDMIAAAGLIAGTLGLLLEPAGAAGIATIRRHPIKGERIATVLTGHGPPAELLPRICGAGGGADREQV
jgi:threonine dehydratase